MATLTPDTPTLRRWAGRPSTKVHEDQVDFTDLASSGFETSDCRILLALIPQLECPTLFAGLSKPFDLKLVSRLEFGSGEVAMRYEPRR